MTTAEWRRRDTAWVTGVALLPPVLILAAGLLVPLLDVDSGTLLGDVLYTWFLVGFFGLLFLVPAALVSLFGAAALTREFRFGRRLASIGSVAVLLAALFVGFAAIAEAVAPTQPLDPYSWGRALSPWGNVLFAVPCLAVAAANVYLLLRLWKRPG